MKASCTEDHYILLSRIYDAGVRGIAFCWFHSYISDRVQQTKVNNKFTDQGKIKYGVSRGQYFLVLLRKIYIYNLCEGCFKDNVVTFANNIALCYKETET